MKFVPLNKQSKKKQKEYHKKNRNDWKEVNPVTKVIPDKRKKKVDFDATLSWQNQEKE